MVTVVDSKVPVASFKRVKFSIELEIMTELGICIFVIILFDVLLFASVAPEFLCFLQKLQFKRANSLHLVPLFDPFLYTYKQILFIPYYNTIILIF